MKARDDIENRIGTDLQDLQRTENLYQAALEDATDSEEGESIEDFGEGDEPDDDAGEDADPVPGASPSDQSGQLVESGSHQRPAVKVVRVQLEHITRSGAPIEH